MKIRVGHLYPGVPEHLRRPRQHRRLRAALRGCAGTSWRSRPSRSGDELRPGEHDLLYIGGGQDREQALIAPDLAAKGDAVTDGGRGRRGRARRLRRLPAPRTRLPRPLRHRHARRRPLPARDGRRRAPDDRRRPARVRARARRAARTVAGFENHAGRTRLDAGAQPLGRVIAGFGNDGESGFEGCRVGRALGTYLHGPLLPRNPWLADWILSQALAHATGGDPPELEPLARPARGRGPRRLGPPRARPRRPFLSDRGRSAYRLCPLAVLNFCVCRDEKRDP